MSMVRWYRRRRWSGEWRWLSVGHCLCWRLVSINILVVRWMSRRLYYLVPEGVWAWSILQCRFSIRRAYQCIYFFNVSLCFRQSFCLRGGLHLWWCGWCHGESYWTVQSSSPCRWAKCLVRDVYCRALSCCEPGSVRVPGASTLARRNVPMAGEIAEWLRSIFVFCQCLLWHISELQWFRRRRVSWVGDTVTLRFWDLRSESCCLGCRIPCFSWGWSFLSVGFGAVGIDTLCASFKVCRCTKSFAFKYFSYDFGVSRLGRRVE